MKIENYGVQEMNTEETRETNGGFLPLVVIIACDVVMLCCSAVALGMQARLNQEK
jgi:lactobin A/cerein 7B family class IIb bacteriocin